MFFGQLFFTVRFYGIDFSLPAFVSDLPFGRDPAVLLHAMKSGVKGTFFHLQQFARNAVNVVTQRVAVERAARFK